MEFEPGSPLWIAAVVLVHGAIITAWKKGLPIVKKSLRDYWHSSRTHRGRRIQ